LVEISNMTVCHWGDWSREVLKGKSIRSLLERG